MSCNKAFRSRAALVQHEDAKHPETTEETEPAENPVEDITNVPSKNEDIKQEVTKPENTKDKESSKENSFQDVADDFAKMKITNSEVAKPENTTEKDPNKENQNPPGPPPPKHNCKDCGEAFYFTIMLSEHEKKFGHGPFAGRKKKEPVEKAKDEINWVHAFELHGKSHEDLIPFKKKETSKEGNKPTKQPNKKTTGPPLTPLNCQHCYETFYYFIELEKHEENCLFRPRPKYREKKFAETEEKGTETWVYTCPERTCNKRSFRNLEALRAHSYGLHGITYIDARSVLTKEAPKDINNPTTQAPKETSNTANQAPKKTNNSTKHTSKGLGFRCIPCDKSFRAEHALEKHWEKEHSNTWWSLFDEDNVSDVSLTYSEFENDGEDMYDDFMEMMDNDRKWRSGKIKCITCWKKFKKTSDMIGHVEMGECHSYIDRKDIVSVIKNHMGDAASQIYKPNLKEKFECPVCKDTFHSLSFLTRHAEGTHFSVTNGPLNEFITELKWRLIEDNHYFD
ncbi:hypothetical protein IL306_001908 [Fusarium sp. DS 682]|nr:hypothetical protein IL306_001908 [Fusarium sp. DS 682]